jgi:hypothetical protein
LLSVKPRLSAGRPGRGYLSALSLRADHITNRKPIAMIQVFEFLISDSFFSVNGNTVAATKAARLQVRIQISPLQFVPYRRMT